MKKFLLLILIIISLTLIGCRDEVSCEGLVDEDSYNICMAEATLNDNFCLKIVNSDVKTTCCRRFFEDTNDINQCLGDTYGQEISESEVIAEEVAQDDFDARSSNCPIAVPDTALATNLGSADGWAQGFKLNGKYIGLVTKYHDNAREIKWSEVCYDEEGKFHGPTIEWSKNNVLVKEGEYNHGLPEGKHIEYHYSNGEIKNYITYINGLTNGLSENFLENGDLHSRIKYENGFIRESVTFCKRGTESSESASESFNGLALFKSLETANDVNGKQTLYKKYTCN